MDKFAPKIQNCLFKVKFDTNLKMLTLMLTQTPCLNQGHILGATDFWGKFQTYSFYCLFYLYLTE